MTGIAQRLRMGSWSNVRGRTVEMVKTTGIGYVVISIGTLLLGVPLAGLVALGVEHLWSGMGWLRFLATLSSWMAFGVSRLFREHGNTDIMPHRMAGRSK